MVRPVRIASICLAPNRDVPPEEVLEKTVAPKEILAEAERVAAEGVDLILTPEVWSGEIAESSGDAIYDFSSGVLNHCRNIARRGNCYMAVCMPRELKTDELRMVQQTDQEGRFKGIRKLTRNSIFLIDRQGQIVYIYDKLYPYPVEFLQCDGVSMNVKEMKMAPVKEGAVIPGNHAGVFDCDFGRLGMRICFDMNFPQAWEMLAADDVELVIWSSAFSGGRNASVRAAANHYYVVSCTCIGKGDCRVIDINGDELLVKYPEQGRITNTVQVTLDLDRMIFHKNFNEGKIREILIRYGDKISLDDSLYEEEEWMILQSSDPNLSVHSLCEEYGLIPLRAFKNHVMPDYIETYRC